MVVSQDRLYRYVWDCKHDLIYSSFIDDHFYNLTAEEYDVRFTIEADWDKTDLKHLEPWHLEALKNPNHAKIKSYEKKRRPFVPQEQRDAVSSYIKDSKEFNTALRAKGYLLKKHRVQAEHLDKVINHPLQHNTVVYRALSSVEGSHLLKHRLFHSKAFSSSSFDPEVSDAMASHSAYRARIFLKKGDTGAYLPHARNDTSFPDNEEEFLLPRNQKFGVMGYHWDPKSRHYYFDMEMHPWDRRPIRKRSENILAEKIRALVDTHG